MNATEDALTDWIASATIPGTEGLYFVGTFDRRITFYSQQVRAFRLIRALHEKGRVKEADAIAVVGGAAAGVTCSLALALLGYQVTLFDPADEAIQLQSASPRLLHPHIGTSRCRREGHPLHQFSVETYGPPCSQVEFKSLCSLLQRIRSHGTPWPRWISARPEPQ